MNHITTPLRIIFAPSVACYALYFSWYYLFFSAASSGVNFAQYFVIYCYFIEVNLPSSFNFCKYFKCPSLMLSCARLSRSSVNNYITFIISGSFYKFNLDISFIKPRAFDRCNFYSIQFLIPFTIYVDVHSIFPYTKKSYNMIYHISHLRCSASKQA